MRSLTTFVSLILNFPKTRKFSKKMPKPLSYAAVKCPICESLENNFIRSTFDDRYGYPGMFNLVCCNSCGHYMTLPHLAESDLPSLYGDYYPRKYIDAQALVQEARGTASLLAWLRRWWEGTDNQGQYSACSEEVMLDVGCGSGLSLLEAKALGAKAVGIEADPNVQRIANELGLEIHSGNLHNASLSSKLFDLIVLNQVIEHIPEPDILFHDLKRILKPGGRVILVFPNRRSLWCLLFGEKWINWHIPYHQHHFDLKGFKRFAARFGFSIVRKRTITPNIWTVLQLRAAIVQPVCGKPTSLWAVPPTVVSDLSDATVSIGSTSWPFGRIFRKILRILVFAPISLLNRLVDVVGYGDSFLVELRIRKE